ncbi:MAG: TonB-dependent receptor [Bacteroidetes bacterium]|nr:MAG: TonB-dependent receptor [Bacteroidota bacterium]
MKNVFFFCFLLAAALGLSAQSSVTGKVSDGEGQPLPGVTVMEKGTTNGTLTDEAGTFSLRVSGSNTTLVFSLFGYQTQDVALAGRTEIEVSLVFSEFTIGEVKLVGTRSSKRSVTATAVPIDVIDFQQITANNGQVEINQALQYLAPSFNAVKQSGSDGADHIDPATLRGLGPDQTLVLINGKRRHQSSLVNVFGTRGRGNTGTDLNAIPSGAIKRIEILRDGASAQYGSDAIAGVVNIVLKDQVDVLSGSITYGGYNAKAPGEYPAGTANTDPESPLDGLSTKIVANYGTGIGEGGFINVTTELVNKEKILRPGADFRKGFGEAGIRGFNVFANAAVPIGKRSEFYAFGGRNFRDTDAFAFTRNNPTERNVVSIYPNGFTPRITSIITDQSLSAGIRTRTESGWDIDLNNTIGSNDFHYYIKGTLNASLQEASPTEFDAGGHKLTVNTTNLDFSKTFDVLESLNLAFGAEYRTENFLIFAGEPGSYATYDTAGLEITRGDQVAPTDPLTGEVRPGGSQGFPGYSPANVVDKYRSNIAAYFDTEFEFTPRFLLDVALRYENYSDFGSTFNFKAATRFKVSNALNLRASASSGFRAPSLAQIYYNLRFTNFVGGIPIETLLSPNNSPVTRGFGIQPLKQETANNYSLGFTLKQGNFSATVDGYLIDVADRIVLTGYFDATTLGLNVSSAQFFVNGIDTRTAGLDIVLSYNAVLGNGSFGASLVGNINRMEVTSINKGNLDQATFFGPRDEYFLLASAPPNKFGLNLSYSGGPFSANVTLTRFGKVELLDYQIFEYDDQLSQEAIDAARDVYDPRLTLDASLGYDINSHLKFVLGTNNLFNAYPTQQDADWTETGGYVDPVQMGIAGAFYYARLGFTF